MSKVWTILAFAAAVALVLVGFAPAGGALGELLYDVYGALTEGGASANTAALLSLLGLDAVALLLAFGVSFAGGVRLPSGLPHLFFALLVPLTLGATQVRFFELAGGTGDLAETFGTYNFVVMFLASIAVAQLGVHLSRRRHERQEATFS